MDSKKKRHTPTKLWERGKADNLAILRPIQLFDKFVPRRINHKLSEWVGGYLIFGLMSRTRRKLKFNLAAVGEGQFSRKKIRDLAQQTIQNYGKYLIDYLYFPTLTQETIPQFISEIEGYEFLEESIQQGNGAILLSPHLGHWELGGLYLSLQNHPISVISLVTGDREITEYRDQVRTQKGIEVIYLDPQNSALNSALEIISVLRKGGIIAMLGDRNTSGEECVVTDFFHKKYHFPKGPYILSLLNKTPILPAFVVLEGLQYKLILEKPFVVERKKGVSRDEAILQAVNHIAKLFEKYIRQYPSQWYNWYPTWQRSS